jgi:GNAT superfamily N-acetyltransferase
LSRNLDDQPLVGGWEPVGFLPGLPNMNELLVHSGGLRFPWQWLRLLAGMSSRRECMTIKSVLIPPEYWAKGVSVRLFSELFRKAIDAKYRWIDLSLTNERNPYTPDLATRMGARIYRAYQIYARQLDKPE